MYWADTTIVIVLALGALFGALSGLVRQVARLVGLILAVYAALTWHDEAAELLEDVFFRDASPWLSGVLAYVVVFLGIYLAVAGVGVLIGRWVKAARLQKWNRALGASFGTFKAAVLLGALLLGLSYQRLASVDDVLEKSTLAPALLEVVHVVLAAVPAEYSEGMRAELQRLRDVGRTGADTLRPPAVSSLP
jgi:uncharacterized membrane protein required for colicin V production